MAKPQIHDIYMPAEGVTFDVEAFDAAINTHGLRLIHYRCAPCPIGVTDEFDTHAHAAHDNCSNGFIYEEAGTCVGFISGNQTSPSLENLGVLDGSTVQVTLPRYYDSTDKEISVQDYDRFYMADIQTYRTTSQKFEHSQTGVDRLRYPIIDVDFLMDAHGERYKQDVDFAVNNGYIKWMGRRPGYDPKIERGTICSVRYRYQPFWYVKSILHEVRVAKDVDYVSGDVKLVRMPYAILLQREYVFENEENSKRGTPDARDTRGPRKGGFGAR